MTAASDTKIVTLRRLEAMHACEGARLRVEQTYPKGVPLTAKAALDLEGCGVDVWWAVSRMLRRPGRLAFVRWATARMMPRIGIWAERAGEERGDDDLRSAGEAMVALDPTAARWRGEAYRAVSRLRSCLNSYQDHIQWEATDGLFWLLSYTHFDNDDTENLVWILSRVATIGAVGSASAEAARRKERAVIYEWAAGTLAR